MLGNLVFPAEARIAEGVKIAVASFALGISFLYRGARTAWIYIEVFSAVEDAKEKGFVTGNPSFGGASS